MPHEITSRIRRDELLELLETEAPVTHQRTTAPMPAVTLTDLLCIREDELAEDDALAPPPPQPVRRMRANTVPAADRSRVRATGTDLEIVALPADSAPAAEPDAPSVSRTSTFDTPALIVDRAPAFEPVPDRALAEAAHELAQLLTCDAGPAVSRTQTPRTRRVQIPTGALTYAALCAPAPTAQELSSVSLRPSRPLVIAASCLVTLVLALLLSLL